ncbi:protein EXECUTER 1, chloroplastic isoform X1 [Dendrobium catenatum]|uniref:Protein EXECUTER 1, chloroplastic n=1 Tax=Dendrobium catenatum TaxID=906689 RepID=A0A2I0WDJ5_9ASPA|nr:protein EXECUTER 1, chloroplastic isoform X1 [Dendrobium catenatum]XP_020700596.1 protein EXECUTER 1, chloroplastic isoform X1 [Dendrobium catenatum]PKU73725.1 Protein EXECUTER 1, chloroplastic [Dendrobium catenatum]
MASISAARPPSTALMHNDSNPSRYPSHFPRFIAAAPRCPLSPPKRSELGLCRCRNPLSGSPPSGDDGGWKRLDLLLHDVVRGAVKRLEDCVNSFRQLSDMGGLQLGSAGVGKKGEAAVAGEEVEGKGWDWKRWKRHFAEIEEQEWIASVLKMQLSDAVAREDYEAAAKLKVALHAANKTDTIGSAIHEYNKAIAEERYNDAAFLQDNAGTGLLGWWAGISKDGADTYGRIAHISAEHGRYVARSYSSRQLAMSQPGSPLFEIYFTCDDEGYKQQAVYLKRNRGHTANISKKSSNRSTQSLSESNGSTEEPTDISSEDVKTIEEVDDNSDWIGLSGIKNILQDVIPGVKVKVLKVVAPGKVDGDLISKVIEQIIEEDEDSDGDIQDSAEEYIKSESDIEEVEMVGGNETSDTTEEQSEVSVKFVIGSLLENIAADATSKDLVRVPAELEIRDNLSFSFSVKKEDLQPETDAGQASQNKIVSRSLQRSSDHARSDLPKVFVSKEKMPIKVLVDIGELIRLSINHNQNQLLVGTTHFNRIEIPTTLDPLSGLYIGAHGMYTSELLHLKRRFGQWHEDDGAKKPKDLEFYEYVEAYKLTGVLSIPAGEVVFRAKVGKKNQLPHKGIIPEEFGVIARYRAQGRLADPGFQNPRWVDGELVILDGKNIRGGPIIGFVYWAPEHHFLVFFNRLKLPD